MKLKEFKEMISKIESEHPNADEMDIGPVFRDHTIMNTVDVTYEPNAGWDGKDAIGIIWMC